MQETERINKAIDEFAEAIKERMVEKYNEGYTGWDSEYSAYDLCLEIADDAAGIEINLAHNRAAIDIGARAMMLWYRDRS